MIDCHAHAYPPFAKQISKLAERLSPAAGAIAEVGTRRLTEAAARLGKIVGRRSEKPTVDIEWVARSRAGRSERAKTILEGVTSTLASPLVLASGSIDNLLASMQRHGIDQTVLIGAPPIAPNDWLLAQARHDVRGRLLPVPTLPELASDAAPEVWHQAYVELADGGAVGFKIHPNIDGLPPDHPAYHALFEVAAARGLFVILHTGCFHVPIYKDHAPAEPGRFEALFAKHPGVRVCLAHMNREHPERAWEIMKRYGQLFADTSWQPAAAVRAAIDAVGADRIVLGSDWPLLHPDLQGDALGVVRRAASDAEVEQICASTPRVLLGLR